MSINQLRSLVESLANKIDHKEDRVWGFEDRVEE